jgi:tetratricopeptide (TPR) repeat protein
MLRTLVQAAESAPDMAETALELVSADPVRAAEQARRALELARRNGDLLAQSMAHRALGLAARELGNLATALRALSTAVRVAAEAGLDVPAGQARMSRALVLLSQGRITDALLDAEASAVNLRGLDRARLLAQRGLILQRAGRLDDALAVYAAAMPSLRRHRDRLWEGRLRNNRAVLYAYQGSFRLAKADIARAEQLFEELELPRALAGARWNHGFVGARRGDIPAALASLDAAGEAYRQAGMPVGLLLVDQCDVLLAAGLVAEARQVAITAVAELSAHRQAADLAEARLMLARAELADGAPAAARRTAAAAQRSFASQQRSSWAAVARHVGLRSAWADGERSPALLRSALETASRLEAAGWAAAALDTRLMAARMAVDLGRLDVARTQLTTAARARRSPQLDLQAQAWHALALLRLQSGDRRGAYVAVSAGLDAADQRRALLGATELRVQVARQVEELADLGVAVAVEEGAAAQVLCSTERHRAAAMRMRPLRPPRDPALASLLARLQAAALRAEEALLADAPSRELDARRSALELQVRRRIRYATGAPGAPRGQPLSAPDGQALAEALGDRVLVEYLECAGDLHAVVLRAGECSLHRLGPAGPVELEAESLRFAWRRLLTSHGSAASLEAAQELATAAGAHLDAALMLPLASLTGNRPLVVVPTGFLQSLPWPVLPSCAGRALTMAPSAATWLSARNASRNRAAGGDAAAGLATGLAAGRATGGAARRVTLIAGPGLPGSGPELDAVAALYPAADVLTGQAATVGAALRALDGADVAHIAAHGRFRADNAMFSSLVLADGPLTVYDLEGLRHAPRAIMLAACDSALSPALPGDEMTGLVAALLALGTTTVIAALLPVPDPVMGSLALGWHREASSGRAPAEALLAMRAQACETGPLARVTAAALACLGYGG